MRKATLLLESMKRLLRQLQFVKTLLQLFLSFPVPGGKFMARNIRLRLDERFYFSRYLPGEERWISSRGIVIELNCDKKSESIDPNMD